MSNIIDKIRLSGVTYTLSGQSGGGNPTVELTQAEYDALVSAGTVSADTYYIITDAQGGDLSNYWTSAQTNNAITQAVSGKQDTLVSGTNIKTINNESILGSGNIDIQGGKAVSGGTNISITTGETADTINCTLNAKNGTGNLSFIGNGILGGTMNSATGASATAFGLSNNANARVSFVIGGGNYGNGEYSFVGGNSSEARGNNSFAFGYGAKTIGNYSIAFGSYFPLANNTAEVAIGKANVSHTGSTDADKTLFSVGNGTADNARHNAFEIRMNGDIYLSSGGTDIKLQDHLGSGGGGITSGEVQTMIDESISGKQDTLIAGTNITISGNVISAQLEGGAVSRGDVEDMISAATSGLVESSAITSAVTSASTDSEIPTAKAVYDAIPTGGTGGGKAISAGTNISVTTGETADTINCTLPITAGTNSNGKGIIIGDSECSASGKYAIAIGHNADANGENSLVIGDNTGVNGTDCIVVGSGDATSYYKGGSKFISVGGYNSPNYTSYSALFGSHVTVKNNFEVGIGTYNISNTGSTEADKTRFSIGNGYHFGATNVDHNIIDVRSNGDIYIADTNVSGEYYEKPMIKLQDTVSATTANTTALGGLSLVKLTQNEYDALATKNNSTLYVIVN